MLLVIFTILLCSLSLQQVIVAQLFSYISIFYNDVLLLHITLLYSWTLIEFVVRKESMPFVYFVYVYVKPLSNKICIIDLQRPWIPPQPSADIYFLTNIALQQCI